MDMGAGQRPSRRAHFERQVKRRVGKKAERMRGPRETRSSDHKPKPACGTTQTTKGKKRERRRWSGRRVSNSRPQPWQGCALPTELLPRCEECALYTSKTACQGVCKKFFFSRVCPKKERPTTPVALFPPPCGRLMQAFLGNQFACPRENARTSNLIESRLLSKSRMQAAPCAGLSDGKAKKTALD